MAKLHLSNPWWPTVALSGAGFLLGFAVALVFLLGAESERIEDLKQQLLQANARLETLQTAKQSINLALAATLPRPMDPPVEPVAPPSTAMPDEIDPEGGRVTAGVKAPVNAPIGIKALPGKVAVSAATVAPTAQPPKPEPPKPTPPKPVTPKPVLPKAEPAKPAAVKAEPAKPAAVKPAPAKPAPVKAEPVKPDSAAEAAGKMHLPVPGADTESAGQKTAAAPTTNRPVAPVDEAEVKAAIATNSIEMAPKAKMGVEKVTAGGVVMSSGGTIRVGERFTSGERLLSVDKETGRIVTDKRTVVIMQ